MSKGIAYEIELLNKQIKQKKGLLSTLKANKFKFIAKTMERLEQEITNLEGQRDSLFRLYQRGHK